jgi:hypothetical protein
MTNGHHQTVFKITKQGYDWWFPAIGIGIAAVGFALMRVTRNRTPRTWRNHWQFHAMAWFGTVWALFLFAVTLPECLKLRRAYRSGTYSIVEGDVHDFHPMPKTGHDTECFSVKQNRFCYSGWAMGEPGFQKDAAHGGPMRAGLPVRIAYVDGRILRLEIQQMDGAK